MSPYIGYDSDTTFLPGTVNTSSSLTIQGGGITQTGGDVNFDSGTLFIDEDLNRVGIGITNPSQKLSVQGNILADGTSTSHWVASSKAGVTTSYLITDASGSNIQVDGDWPIRFTTNSTEKLRVTGSGNVGIGTTNPSKKLHVEGSDILVNGVTIGRGDSSTNVVIGTGVGTATGASQSVFIGESAGRVNTSYRNTAVGYQAMYNADISPTNTAIGYQALYTMSGYTYYNTAIGRYALGALTSGTSNIAIGHNAGATVTTGSGNICIAAAGPSTGSSNILIGGSISGATGAENYNVIVGYVSAVGVTNNNIIFGDGQGNERLRINGSGNVGIGTTNPTQKLHVEGNLRLGTDPYIQWISNYLRFQTTNASIPVIEIRESSSGNYEPRMDFYDGDGITRNISIDANPSNPTYFKAGNVGIGTTNPASILHVVGTLRSTGQTYLGIGETTTITYIGDPFTANTKSILFNRSSTITDFVNIQGLNAGVGYTSFTMQALGGNVGIGTTNPAKPLHATGEVQFSTNTKTHVTHLFTTGNANDGVYVIKDASSIDKVLIHSNGSSYLNGGNVGIGTTNPWTKLDVYGDIAVNGTFAIRRNNYGYSAIYKNVFIGSTDSISNTVSLCVDTSTISGGNFHGQNQVIVPRQGLLVPNQAGTNFIGVLSRDSNNYIRIGPETAGGIPSGPITVTTSNVGIGTTGPSTTLEVRKGGTNTVSGSLFGGGFTQTIVSGESQLCLVSNIDETGNFGSIEAARGGIGFSWADVNDRTRFIVGTNSNHPLRLYTNASEKVRISETGNLGIGITNPNNKLVVQGGTTITGDVLMTGGVQGSPGFVYLNSGGADATDTYLQAGSTADVWSAVRVTGNWTGSATGGGAVRLYTAGQERLTVNSAGVTTCAKGVQAPMGWVYQNTYTINSTWSSGWQTIIPSGICSFGTYVVSLYWDYAGAPGAGSPYYITAATIFTAVPGTNGTGTDNAVALLSATHTGGTNAYLQVRTIAFNGGNTGLQVNIVNYTAVSGTIFSVYVQKIGY